MIYEYNGIKDQFLSKISHKFNKSRFKKSPKQTKTILKNKVTLITDKLKYTQNKHYLNEFCTMAYTLIKKLLFFK